MHSTTWRDLENTVFIEFRHNDSISRGYLEESNLWRKNVEHRLPGSEGRREREVIIEWVQGVSLGR